MWGSALDAECLAIVSLTGEASVLTQLAHFQDVTEHLGQLYTAAAEGTFMLIFSAAVLKHNLCGKEETAQKRNSVTKHIKIPGSAQIET